MRLKSRVAKKFKIHKSRDEKVPVAWEQGKEVPRLPYTQATLIEIQRVARVAPSSLPHKTTAPTKVGEFSFPPNSIFMANLSFITHDPSNIEDPFAFKPDRWIDEAGR